MFAPAPVRDHGAREHFAVPVYVRAAGVRVADLVLDPATRSVRRGDVPVNLSAKEFALLQELIRRAGETLTRTHLIEQLDPDA